MTPSSKQRSGVIRRATQNKAPKSRRQTMPSQPPMLPASNTVNHTFRFQANAGTSLFINRGNLLNSLVMGFGGTTQYRIINAIKVNSVQIWSVAAVSIGNSVQPTPAQISFEWLSTYGPSRILSDMALGATTCARIFTRPAPNSLASFWSLRATNESDTLFSVSATQNSVLDLNVTYVLQDDTVASSVTTTASSTTGVQYYTYLDGPRGGAVWAPMPATLPSIN